MLRYISILRKMNKGGNVCYRCYRYFHTAVSIYIQEKRNVVLGINRRAQLAVIQV